MGMYKVTDKNSYNILKLQYKINLKEAHSS